MVGRSFCRTNPHWLGAEVGLLHQGDKIFENWSDEGDSNSAGKWGQENLFACHFPAPIFLPKSIMLNSVLGILSVTQAGFCSR